jgi:hypothetical protein
MEIFKKKPINLWKDVELDKYQVNAIFIIIYYKTI